MEHKQDYIMTSPFDACANNENDLEMLFAMAPVDATHVDTTDKARQYYMKQIRSIIYYWGGEDWVYLQTSEVHEYWVEIPDRERELNLLADNWILWANTDAIVRRRELGTRIYNGGSQTPDDANWFSDEEIEVRRALRHPEAVSDQPYQSWAEVPGDLKWYLEGNRPWHVDTSRQLEIYLTPDSFGYGWHPSGYDETAGKSIYNRAQYECARSLMPDVNDTDVVDIDDSQPEQWLPEVGDSCKIIEWTGSAWVENKYDFKINFIGDRYVIATTQGTAREVEMCFKEVKFRPIDQQAKAREATIAAWSEFVIDTLGSEFTMKDAYGVIYDWMKEKGDE